MAAGRHDIDSRRLELQRCLDALRSHEQALEEWRADGANGDLPMPELPQPSWMTPAEYRSLREVGREASWRLRRRLIESSVRVKAAAPPPAATSPSRLHQMLRDRRPDSG